MDNPMVWAFTFFGVLGLSALALHKFGLVPRIRLVRGTPGVRVRFGRRVRADLSGYKQVHPRIWRQ